MPYTSEKRTDSAHLYLDISLKLKKLLSHHTEPEQKLPSLRQISQEFDISLSTAQSAYQQLIDEGLVQVRPVPGISLPLISASSLCNRKCLQRFREPNGLK